MRVLFALALITLPTVASAHKTGTELRTAEECKKLQPPARGHCQECVSRARPHHYHPDAPAGLACRPEDAPK